MLLVDVSIKVAVPGGDYAASLLQTFIHFHKPSKLLHNICSEVVYVSVALAAVKIMSLITKKVNLGNIGLTKESASLELAIGFVVQLASAIVILDVIGKFKYLTGLNSLPTAWLFQILILFLLTAIAEEVISRGYVFQIAEHYWGSGIAVVVSFLVFGFDHIIGGGLGALSQACGAAISGVFYSAAYLATRRLWLPIGLHWAWDFLLTVEEGRGSRQGIIPSTSSGQEQQNIATLDAFVLFSLTAILFFVAWRRGHWCPRTCKRRVHYQQTPEA